MMKPKYCLKILVYMFLLSFFMLAKNAEAKEVGDVWYEIKSKQWGAAGNQYDFNEFIGHAMIFAGTDEDGNDHVIHTPGDEVKFQPLSESGYNELITDLKCFSGISKEQRKKILSFAHSKRRAPYPLPGKSWFVFIEIPSLEQQKGYQLFQDKECYSCVGLVERAYEEAGLNPTPNGFGRDLIRTNEPLYTTWTEAEGSYVSHNVQYPYNNIYGWVFFPYTQWYKQIHPYSPLLDTERTFNSISNAPAVEIMSPGDKSLISPKVNYKYPLKAKATDGPDGSGIFKVEYYFDVVDSVHLAGKSYTYKNSEGDPIFYYENASVPVELPEYIYEWDISNLGEGEHILFVKTVDRAGNWSNTINRSFIIDSTSPQLILSGVTNNAEYIGSRTVRCVISDANLDKNAITLPSGFSKTAETDTSLTYEAIFSQPNTYTLNFIAKDKAGNESSMTITFKIKSPEPLPPDEHPDDNEYPGDTQPPEVKPDANAPVAVLTAGFYKEAGALLSSLKESYTLCDLNFSPTMAEKYPLLIIPSGGLYGLENSLSFKARLAEYVQKGGNVICFSQQAGTSFNVLPRGVSGFGWFEDQGCHSQAVNIQDYHQVLSSLKTASNIDIDVDGYFTQWPAETKVLLKRNKNFMPAMILYKYGLGSVAVTSAYPDWGFLGGQLTPTAKRITRDMVGWMKEAIELPEYGPGTGVNFMMQVTNSGLNTQTATQVKITVLDPDKNIVSTATPKIADLVPGASTQALVSLITTSNLGIWSIRYQLLDVNNSNIGSEQTGLRFVVSQPPEEVDPDKNIQLWVTTPSEKVAKGSPVLFNIFIKNNSAENISGAHIEVVSGHVLNDPLAIDNIAVAAEGEENFIYEAQSLDASSTFEFYLKDKDGTTIAAAQKGVFVINPLLKINLNTDKTAYAPGEAARIGLSLENLSDAAYNAELVFKVTDQDGAEIGFLSSIPIDMPASGGLKQDLEFNLSAQAKAGPCIVYIDAFYQGERIGSSTAYFQVNKGNLEVIPQIPLMKAGDNFINILIKNTENAEIPQIKLEVSFEDPDGYGVPVSNNTADFSLAGGGSVSKEFNISLYALKFGSYRLRFALEYGEIRASGYTDISCDISVKMSFDKTFYRIRETLGMNVGLSNNGKFEERFTLNIDSADCGFSGSAEYTLLPGGYISVPYSGIIPDTLQPGIYRVYARPQMANQVSKSFSFVVPEARLDIVFEKLKFSAGENINLNLKNTGGVDGQWDYKLRLLDAKGAAFFEISGMTPLLLAGTGSAAISFTIPAQLISGWYSLNLSGRNAINGKELTLNKYVEITGLNAALNISAEKQIYNTQDEVKARAEITNLNGRIENAALDLKIYNNSIPSWKNYTAVNRVNDMAVNGNYAWFATDGGVKRLNITTGEWKTYTTADGLLSNDIWGIAAKGDAVWVHTFSSALSISRYDKTSDKWQSFQQEELPMSSLISCIEIDNDNVWFACYSNGIMRYSTVNNLWQYIPLPDITTVILDIKADGDYLWLAAGGNLIKFDKRDNSCQAFDIIASKIEVDAQSVWCADAYYNSSAKLTRFNKADNTWETDTLSGTITTLAVDTNYLWVGGWFYGGYGARRYDKANNSWEDIAAMPADAYSVWKIVRGDDAVWFLGADFLSIRRCAMADNTWQNIEIGDSIFKYNNVHLIEPDGNYIWFVNNNGAWTDSNSEILRYDKTNDAWRAFSMADGMARPGTVAIAIDNDYVWTPFSEGLNRYDKKNDAWQIITRTDGVNIGNPKCIAIDGDYVWTTSTGTDMPVSKYDKVNDTWTAYSGFDTEKILVDGNYVWFMPVPDNCVAGAEEPLLIKYDKLNDKWRTFTAGDLPGVRSSIIAMQADGEYVWFGTYWDGIVRYNKNNDSWQAFELAEKMIKDIVVDGNYIWAATLTGISRYDKINGDWMTTGPPGYDLNFTAIVHVDEEYVWCSAGTGYYYGTPALFRYSKITDTWQKFSTADGLASDKVNTIVADGDCLWFGTDNGLSRYQKYGKLVWENILPVNSLDSNATVDIPVTIGRIGEEGKLSLKGSFNAQSGQVIAEGMETFYIFKGEGIYLTLDTDKRVYKPNEEIKISGEVRNNTTSAVTGLSLVLEDDVKVIHSQVLALDAGQSCSFGPLSVPAVNSFYLKGKLIKDSTTVAQISDYLEVIAPDISAQLNCPDVAGSGVFDVELRLSNDGKADVKENLSIVVNEEKREYPDVAITAGNSTVIKEQFSITKDSALKVTLSGDVSKTLEKNIIFGEAGQLSVTPASSYAEGTVSVPYEIQNTGLLDFEGEAVFSLKNSLNEIIDTISERYYLPKSQNLPGELIFYNLSADDYTLSYSFALGGGAVPVKVSKFDRAQICRLAVESSQLSADNKFPIQVTVKNTGGNAFIGVLKINTGFYENELNLDLPAGEETAAAVYVPVNVSEGSYTAKAQIIRNGGIIDEKTQAFGLAAKFEVVSMPENPVFAAGSEGIIKIKLKNTGNSTGSKIVSVECADIIAQTQNVSLSVAEEKELSFNFQTAEDLGAGQYSAVCKVGETVKDIPFRIEGVKVSATAGLDKEWYNEGDTAILNLNIVNNCNLNAVSLFLRVQFNDYSRTQNFILNNAQNFSFNDIPVKFGQDEKIFYGIYNDSGRSLYLNYIYLRKATPDINVYTDKKEYKIGEKVTVCITANQAGSLHLSAFGRPEDLTISGPVTAENPVTFQFTLPPLSSGIYQLAYTFSYGGNKIDGIWPFNVNGYDAKVSGLTFDKYIYQPQEMMNVNLEIEANQQIPARIKFWIYTAEEGYKEVKDIIQEFNPGKNSLKLSMPAATGHCGIHQLFYSIYSQDLEWLLSSGSRAFEISGVSLVLLAAQKEFYYENEEITVKLGTFSAQKQTDCKLQFLIGEEIIKEAILECAGYEEHSYSLPALKTGVYDLTARLIDGESVSRLKISFEVKEQPVKIELSKDFSKTARVLVVLGKEDKRDDIEEFLKSQDALYKIVIEKEELIREFRLNKYNQLWLFDAGKFSDTNFNKELREAVNKGLILISNIWDEGNYPVLDETMGVKFEGFAAEASQTITLKESGITSPGVIFATTKPMRVELVSGEAVAELQIEEKGKNNSTSQKKTTWPAIVLNEYGLGKTVLFAFDFRRVEPIDNVFQILAGCLKYRQPEVFVNVSTTLPMEINIKNKGIGVELNVEEHLNEKLAVLEANAGKIDGDKIYWDKFLLEPDKEKKLVFLLKAPEDTGIYAANSYIYYKTDENGQQKCETIGFDIKIEKGIQELIEEAVAGLDNLQVSGESDANRITLVKEELYNIKESVDKEADFEFNIRQIVKTIDKLMEVESVPVQQIRLMLDRILGIYEFRSAEEIFAKIAADNTF